MKEMAVGSGQQLQRKGKAAAEKGRGAEAVVVVAVRATVREIPKTAVVWALTHVVQHGDTILLLVVIPPQSSGRKFWGFPLFAGDCASGHKAVLNEKSDVSELCSQMMLKLRDVYDPSKINVKVKVVSGSPSGAVATESKRGQASWVVLDKELKHEEKRCMEELQCNIVVMKRSRPKVLRLNLVGSPEKDSKAPLPPPTESSASLGKTVSNVKEQRSSIRGPAVTPNSSPESEAPFGSTDVGTSSVSSSDPGTSPFCASETNSSLKKEATKENFQHSDVNISDSESETSTPPAASSLQPWMAEILQGPASRLVGNRPRRTPTADSLLEKISKLDLLTEISAIRSRSDLNFRGNVRDAVSLSRNAPPGPPPLCSICQHKTPVFGKPPRWFSYAELELATGGFSKANFLAEGGFGSVHRGILPDGQAIAVKQHKLASSQGDVEFCSEVEVLSCAQHRNVVMLIGFCVEDKRRLLVYEYICNGSLDSHLYGRNKETLGWAARHKIAVGAARGLRYLHEECRVGCIIHRDMRPNNILVTHDFEPLVGDFGLARWQPDGDMGVETRIIGTFGYLAPEYAQSGQITEKADVYSFGVVLVELVTGRKAVDINRPKGQQFLTEWARPLLEGYAIDDLIDPRLRHRFCENEVYCMLHAANLCIRRDPHSRPRMSHVLRILEGDMVVDSGCISAPSSDAGSMSRRMLNDQQRYQEQSSPIEQRIHSVWAKDKTRSSCSLATCFVRRSSPDSGTPSLRLFVPPRTSPPVSSKYIKMSEHSENATEKIMNSIMDTIAENLPKQKSGQFDPGSVSDKVKNKLFGRQKSVHRVFGGGRSADVLLWRNKKISSSVLALATAIWVFFEWLDYHFLTIISFSLVLGMVVQFVWSNFSSIISRSPSKVPRVELPDELFVNIAVAIGAQVNKFLSFLQDVSCGRNLKHFVLAIVGLWAAAVIGSWCNFLSVIYIGFVCAHTLPVLYEKYEDQVDDFLYSLLGLLRDQYQKVDQGVLSKLPKGNMKFKKSE